MLSEVCTVLHGDTSNSCSAIPLWTYLSELLSGDNPARDSMIGVSFIEDLGSTRVLETTYGASCDSLAT